MEPITRQEQLLDSIATGNPVELEPITREEQYLSAIAGSTDLIPEKPITRKEMFYEKILESGGGGGGDGTAKPEQTKTIEITENGTYKITPDSGKVLSSATAKVNVPERYEEGFQAGVDSVKLQEKTVTENGDVLPDEGFAGMSKVTVAVPTGSSKEEQEKSITITQNGTTEVTPDEGKTLSKVTVTASVSGGSDDQLTAYMEASLTSVNSEGMAAGLITLRSYIFHEQKQLVSAYLPNIKNIDNDAFYNCEKLNTIYFPKIQSIGREAFYKCAFTNITFPNTLKSVSDDAFKGCGKLKDVVFTVIPTSYRTSAFTNCGAIETFTIPENWNYSIYLNFSEVLTQESLHGMIENLADRTGQTAGTFKVGSTNLAKIDEEHLAMLQTKNWNYS